MPSTSDRNLTLTTQDSNVTVKVKYNAKFTTFERRLAGLGMVFRERINVLGLDPDNGTTGDLLERFPIETIPVTDGNGTQVLARNRSITVPRSTLQEDPGLGDTDAIRCRIEIVALGLPPAITEEFTDVETLLG